MTNILIQVLGDHVGQDASFPHAFEKLEVLFSSCMEEGDSVQSPFKSENLTFIIWNRVSKANPTSDLKTWSHFNLVLFT